MPRNKNLIVQRNNRIRQRFKYYRNKNPKWAFQYILAAVADDFCLSTVTVQRILTKTEKTIILAV